MKTPSDLVFPGTHNSGAYCVNHSWTPQSDFISQLSRFTPIQPIVDRWTINQHFSIEEQLLSGIRYFDLDIVYHPTQQTYWLSHRLATIPLSTALIDVLKFISRYPDALVQIELSVAFGRQNLSSPELFPGLVDELKSYWGPWICPTDPWNQPVSNLYSKNILLTTEDPILCSELVHQIMYCKLLTPVPWIDTSDPDIKYSSLEAQLQSATTGFHLAWTLSPSIGQIVQVCSGNSLATTGKKFNQRLDEFIRTVPGVEKISIISVDFSESSSVVEICSYLEKIRTI